MVKAKKKNENATKKPSRSFINHWYYHRCQFYPRLLLASNAFHVDVASKYFLDYTCAFAPCTIITTQRYSANVFPLHVIVSLLLSSAKRASNTELRASNRPQSQGNSTCFYILCLINNDNINNLHPFFLPYEQKALGVHPAAT